MSRLPGQFKFYPDGHWDDWPSFLMYSSGSPGDGGGGDGGGGGEPPELTPREQAIYDIGTSLTANNAFSAADRDLMRLYDIQLSEIFKPGIYQMEYDVETGGEHRQWVRVNANGTSEILTARADANGHIVVDVAPFETHADGGEFAGVGYLRVYPSEGSLDQTAATAAWTAMLAAADLINDREYNFNIFLQTDNSAFHTIAIAGGLDQVGGGFAFGGETDLFQVNLGSQASILTLDGLTDVVGTASADVLTGSGPSYILGGDGADQITGGSNYDVLEGGAGNDTISIRGGVFGGGAGNDTITANPAGTSGVYGFGDEGDDTITASAFADVIDGGEGDDIIAGGNGDDELFGYSGDDELNGGLGSDLIAGEAGADTIAGGDGDDLISGGAGTDTLTGGAGADIILGGDDTNAYGTTDNDWIDGGAGNDLLYGSGGTDTIYGGDGDDIIVGLGSMWGLGDQLWGGAGSDTFRLDASYESTAMNASGYHGVDVIHDFVSGVDKLDFRALDIALWSPTRVDDIHWWTANGSMFVAWDSMGFGANNPNASHTTLIELVGVTSLSMSDFLLPNENLVLQGGAFADNLRGMDGDDILRGRGGADTLNGGAGSDTADYSLAAAGVTARVDTNVASNDGDGSSDVLVSIENLTGSAFVDLLIGNAGSNALNGGGGGDTLLGFGGNDILIGGPGTANTLQGGTGDDTYVVEANDTIVELAGEGIDTVQTVRTTYTLASNVDNLIYTGTAAFAGTGNGLANAITGGVAADTLTGGAGDDTLTGGKGNDTLAGGDGVDVIVLSGLQADYTFITVAGGVQVSDSTAGRDGVDVLTGIEQVRFSNGATVLLSTLLGGAAPSLSLKDMDDAFVLPAAMSDPAASVFREAVDGPWFADVGPRTGGHSGFAFTEPTYDAHGGLAPFADGCSVDARADLDWFV